MCMNREVMNVYVCTYGCVYGFMFVLVVYV